MPICSFCPLLCEFADGEGIDCSLRDKNLATLAKYDHAPTALVDGCSVTIEKAIEAVNELLLHAPSRTISGHLRSVEGSRAVLALASRINAFVDPSNSEIAFRSIPAIQRSGMTTASMSEIRFRADCIVIVGDNRALDVLPRLGNVLFQRSTLQVIRYRKLPRVVLLGKWSSESLARIRAFGVEVAAVDIDIDKIPQSLFQWSRCSQQAVSNSRNVASQWMSQAKYLTILWSPSLLEMPHADIWVERLFEWIDIRNERSRCVGFPLANDYVTFQQVCTWITGFPGRVQVNGDEFQYRAHLKFTDSAPGSSTLSIAIRIDESIEEAPRSTSEFAPAIIIGPRLHENEPTPRVYIPCGIAGVHHPATFFRADGTVAVEAKEEHPRQLRRGALPLVEVLEMLFLCGCMILGWDETNVGLPNTLPALVERSSC